MYKKKQLLIEKVTEIFERLTKGSKLQTTLL